MDVVTLCSELVKIRSENPPGDTSDIIEYLNHVCESIGVQTTVVKKGGKWNLLSKNPQENLLLCGHVDVVPALDHDWVYPPFSGTVADDRIHGRGSTDMKGGCAALLSALAEVIEKDGDPGADIAFVCDEEGNGDFGMEYLITKGLINTKACLIAEPTPPHTPIIGEKGVLRFTITFTGDAGHASLHPVCGNSAVMQAAGFLSFCNEVHTRRWPSDPLVNQVIENTVQPLAEMLSVEEQQAADIIARVSFNPGIITGGERVNVIAQKCEMEMDMRIPWGCTIESLVAEISEYSKSITITISEIAYPTFSPPGWLCRSVCDGISQVYNREGLPGVTQAATDARHLRAKGAEVVVYGPGDLSLLHSVNESVPVQMLKDCRDVYVQVLRNIPKNV